MMLMTLGIFSYWWLAAIVPLLLLAIAVLAVTDRKMLSLVLRSWGIAAVAIVVAGVGAWAVGRWHIGLTALLVLLLMLVAQVAPAVVEGVKNYGRSMRSTQEHREYLLANGATPLEAAMPSVRLALRAAIMQQLPALRNMRALPPFMLLAGLLLAGAKPLQAVVATLAFAALAFAVMVLAVLLILWYKTRHS